MVAIGLKILIGLALLLIGRKLFWLFVGVVGFLAGFGLAGQILPARAPEATLIVGLVAGLVGVLLAIFLQRFALVAAGFLAGAYLAYSLLIHSGLTNTWLWVGAFLIMGAIGAVLMAVVFNVALAILTSITGALLIIEVLPIQPLLATAAFIVLVVVGLAVQFSQTTRSG